MSNTVDAAPGGLAAQESPSGAKSPLRRALDALYGLSGLIAALSLASIGVLILAQVVARFLATQVRGADDISGYFLASSIFMALAPTFRKAEHIRVGLVIDRLRPALRRPVEMACLLVSAGLVGFFAWASIDMAYMSWELHDVAQGLVAIPLWIPQTTMAAGLSILFIAIVDDLVVLLLKGRPSYIVAAEAPKADDTVAFER